MGLRGEYRYHRWLVDRRHADYRLAPGYFASVRHPLPCLVLLILLLAVYEIGVARMSGGDSLRAGVEMWLRRALADAGPVPPIVIPAALVGLLVLWTLWRWRDRPERLFLTVFGLIVEGIIFGVGLFILFLHAGAIFERAGLPLASIHLSPERAVTFVGVGIYEEAIFRLIGFALLARLLQVLFVPALAAIPMALIVSSLAFAGAHHLGDGEPFVTYIFATRALIGAGFAILFLLRGFGVAVGAHIVYDVLADLAQRTG